MLCNADPNASDGHIIIVIFDLRCTSCEVTVRKDFTFSPSKDQRSRIKDQMVIVKRFRPGQLGPSSAYSGLQNIRLGIIIFSFSLSRNQLQIPNHPASMSCRGKALRNMQSTDRPTLKACVATDLLQLDDPSTAARTGLVFPSRNDTSNCPPMSIAKI